VSSCGRWHEEWRIEGNITGARIASTMQAAAKHLIPPGWSLYHQRRLGWGISTVVDVMGYNYITARARMTNTPIPQPAGNRHEETTTQGTRASILRSGQRPHGATGAR